MLGHKTRLAHQGPSAFQQRVVPVQGELPVAQPQPQLQISCRTRGRAQPIRPLLSRAAVGRTTSTDTKDTITDITITATSMHIVPTLPAAASHLAANSHRRTRH
mmetsp:Transcript_34097/g.75632  ORF Transcript_34097/g.75632 Transcript_34097/m.75632 type:complete len:104 (+) Transcript_34097:2564-2875(+)